ncbi:MAG: ABC transporter permease subunit [Propionibacteriaceae bacterium]|nr:ABC transporter permease subunit [Propionibacteriaceae bacterium]
MRLSPGLPRWAPALAGVGFLVIAAPVFALVWRAPWSMLGSLLASRPALSALRLSLITSLGATVACLVIGVPAALVLSRANGPAASVARAIMLIPLVLPPMVSGLAMLLLLGRRGLVGGPLAQLTGYALPFTTPAVIVAQTFVALPFLIVSAEGSLRAAGLEFERAAASLGARPTRVLRTVTLPLLAPALRGGTVLCFARALGEFGATALFAGNLPGVTQTMPLSIYTAFNGSDIGQDVATALSLVLIGVSLVLLIASGTMGRVRAGHG